MDYQEICLLNMLNEANYDFKNMRNAELTEKNWKKLKQDLMDFSREINTLLENIEDRHKYSSQISSLEGLVSTAERLIKELNSPEICQELKVMPDIPTEEKKPEENKE